ncbi:MAG: DinB family protein, partial [Bacteroidota bacterium]
VLFSHILNAHHVWNSRILQKPAKHKVWDTHDVSLWENMHYENQRTTFEIVTNAEDLNLRIDYENSEGRPYGNELKDMLFHVINHSTHHRGQILAELRSQKPESFPLDYIFYKR